VQDGARAILPAFGALTGSLNIRDAAFDGLFNGAAYEAIMLGTARLAVVAPKRLLPDRPR
jgi:metallophosphoesterase superfamily enzyme